MKDFYTHTPWHTQDDTGSFTSFSFFDPETDKGVLFMFRMDQCGLDTLAVRLPYAEPGAVYTLTDEDSGEVREYSGAELKKIGTAWNFAQIRTSRLVWVEKKN